MSRLHRTFVALALVGTLVLAACSGDDSDDAAAPLPASQRYGSAPTTKPMNATDAAAVDAAAQAAFASLAGKAPGLYVGVWDPKKGFFTKAYGSAQVGGTNATVDDSMRIGSMTNTFTATIVLQLVREGRLSLSDTVRDRAPTLAAAFPQLSRITVRQLLAMQSGIPDYLQAPGGAIADIVANPDRIWTPPELVGAGVELGVEKRGTPGYSSTNYIVLQIIVESVTGTGLQDQIEQRITRPLRLEHTALPPGTDTTLPSPVAHGYLNQGCVNEIAADGAPGLPVGTETTDWNYSFGQGAGGIVSTLADMGVWANTTMGTTSLSKELGLQRIRTRNLGTGLRYGLGIISFGDWAGHAGEAIGWESLGLHDPKTGVTFVAATNACNGTATAFTGMLATLYPGTTPGG
jgi:D-alanyl-D-alanine carboxypeptidase